MRQTQPKKNLNHVLTQKTKGAPRCFNPDSTHNCCRSFIDLGCKTRGEGWKGSALSIFFTLRSTSFFNILDLPVLPIATNSNGLTDCLEIAQNPKAAWRFRCIHHQDKPGELRRCENNISLHTMVWKGSDEKLTLLDLLGHHTTVLERTVSESAACKGFSGEE